MGNVSQDRGAPTAETGVAWPTDESPEGGHRTRERFRDWSCRSDWLPTPLLSVSLVCGDRSLSNYSVPARLKFLFMVRASANWSLPSFRPLLRQALRDSVDVSRGCGVGVATRRSLPRRDVPIRKQDESRGRGDISPFRTSTLVAVVRTVTPLRVSSASKRPVVSSSVSPYWCVVDRGYGTRRVPVRVASAVSALSVSTLLDLSDGPDFPLHLPSGARQKLPSVLWSLGLRSLGRRFFVCFGFSFLLD